MAPLLLVIIFMFIIIAHAAEAKIENANKD
jgi:hypothetical protein